METNEKAELYARVHAARAAGATLEAIASDIGAHSSMVCRWLQRGCWEQHPFGGKRGEHFDAMHAAGVSMSEIARRCLTTRPAVEGVIHRHRRKRAGVPPAATRVPRPAPSISIVTWDGRGASRAR